MMRPLNWPSRRLWSLVTEVMSTVKLASVTVVPLTIIDPEIELVRPTAAWLWPKRTSFTRYPTIEPVAMFQVPSAATLAWPDPDPVVPAVDDVAEGVVSASGAGADPSTKWMKT